MTGVQMQNMRGRPLTGWTPEALTYLEMMRRVAAIEGGGCWSGVGPATDPRLSSRWPARVTNVDGRTGRWLIDSMINEVVVHDNSIPIARAVPTARLRRRRSVALDQRAAGAPA